MTGTIQDVAGFFRVSVRTVQEWIAGPEPRLTHWKEGRNVRFGEEAVATFWAQRQHLAVDPEESLAERKSRQADLVNLGRAEWRLFLEHKFNHPELHGLELRVRALEEIINHRAAA
jgi:excisionase family DNA binding protein